MEVGKVPMEVLAGLLSKVKINDPRVILGPKPGVDAALIDFGDRLLVAKADPVTFATDLIGWYTVNVNANDLAVMGATPRWFMATILLPEGIKKEEVEDIFDQILKACEELNVALIGGHSEITYELPRPIIAGAMLGEVEKGKQITSAGARAGDAIVLTKGIAIEGTSLLARENPTDLADANVPWDIIQKARQLLLKPGISVVKEASIACRTVPVHCMHDPTEGGLATGLLEVAKAANVGMLLEEDRISVLPESRTVCKSLGLNPLGLLASGSLILTVSPQDGAKLTTALKAAGIEARVIGQVTAPTERIKLRRKDGVVDLPVFERDELARYLSS